MNRAIEKFVVLNLRETYHELGRYEFKVVLSAKHFKNSHFCEMTLVDSDGKPMNYEVQKWGRKMNCTFVIDPLVADGVSKVRLSLRKEESAEPQSSLLSFWVIKP